MRNGASIASKSFSINNTGSENNDHGGPFAQTLFFVTVPEAGDYELAIVQIPELTEPNLLRWFFHSSAIPAPGKGGELDLVRNENWNTANDGGYRVPRIVTDVCEARPIHLGLIDGITTLNWAEGPWVKGRTQRIASPGVLICGFNPVATDAVGIRHVARVTAADLQPLGAFAGDSDVDTVVDLEVVGQHQRSGAVDDVGEADGVAEHLLRRALEAEVVGVNDRAVHRDRVHHAKLLELAHQRYVRIDV